MRPWLALSAGCVLTGALVWTGRVPEAGTAWRLAFVGIHLGAFAGLIMWVRTAHPSTQIVLLGALVFRLIALPMLPTLSDDGYRYLWDGRVTIASDASPYEFRPSDREVSEWHSRVEYRRMNSTEYYSVYPPASQLGFALAVALGGDEDWRSAWWVWKAILVLGEIAAIGVLLRLVRPADAALYAWSPLAVIEVAGQGHTEALVVAGVAASLVAARSRWPLASIGLTLAGGVKLYPLVWLPHAWRRDGTAGVVASIGLATLLTIPFWHATALTHVAESLGLFFGLFDEYAAPYLILKSTLYPIASDSAGAVASRLLGVVFVSTVAWGVLRDDGTASLLPRLLGIGMLGFVLTTTTLHPWYWLPLLFLIRFVPLRGAVLWLIAWASAGYLSYVLPEASLVVTAIGWGGAAMIATRTVVVSQRSSDSTDRELASTHSASG